MHGNMNVKYNHGFSKPTVGKVAIKQTNTQRAICIDFFYLFFQLSENGEADYDTIIGMLPEVLADRGGKMFNKCRHVSEYHSAEFLFGLESVVFNGIILTPWNTSMEQSSA